MFDAKQVKKIRELINQEISAKSLPVPPSGGGGYTGTCQIAIGQTATSSGTNTVAIGCSSSVAAGGTNNSVAIGQSASADTTKGIALGPNASTTAKSSIAIGGDAFVSVYYGIAIGTRFGTDNPPTQATGKGAIAIGGGYYGARATADYTVALGAGGLGSFGATASAVGATSIGSNSRVDAVDSIVVGRSSNISATSGGGVAIGKSVVFNNNGAYYAGPNVVVSSAAVTVGNYSGNNIILSNSALTVAGNGVNVSQNILIGSSTFSGYNNNICIKGSALNAANSCIILGPGSSADGVGSAVVIGTSAVATGNGVAIGLQADTGGNQSISIGYDATTSSNYTIAIGYKAAVTNSNGIAIGADASSGGALSIAIGKSAVTSTVGANICIGYSLTNTVTATTMLGGASIAPNTTITDNSTAFRTGAASEVVLWSDLIDFKSTGTITVAIPGGCRFWPSEVGAITTEITGTNTALTGSWGETGNNDALLADTAIATSTTGVRTRFVALDNDTTSRTSTSDLTFEVTVASDAATSHAGRVYWRGDLVEDE